MQINERYSQYLLWLQQNQGIYVGKVKIRLEEPLFDFAVQELKAGLDRLYGEDAVSSQAEFLIRITKDSHIPAEGYKIEGDDSGIEIASADRNGALYGVYECLMKLAAEEDPRNYSVESSPAFSARLINHWDNLDGTIERGYAGKSFFFDQCDFSYDEKRIKDYARALASIGINQISINNVNVTHESAKLITAEMLPKVSKLAEIFRPFGIRLILSVAFGAPIILGGIDTADPLDARVSKWWADTIKNVYEAVPDLAGFLIKADSESQHGPAVHGRTPADGANVISRALARYGGTLYWRCFVYNCNQDWRDMETDRPMAAYEHFFPMDGAFEKNVVLMIKNGPVDFQVREPNSPLLGAMEHTRQGIELQITQEYTGQQIDLYSLAVHWQDVFDFPINETQKMRDLAGNKVSAIAAVVNVGRDENWTGHTLAQCNLFAYGQLAWNPYLCADEITQRWIGLTFGNNAKIAEPLKKMMLDSRGAYEKYTAPMGIGWMVNVSDHYGPSVDGYEYSMWGTYHRADHERIGVDRTERGTGLLRQYHPYVAALFDDPNECPENLLLFFHRLPYGHVLKSGKTLLQNIYDTHFEGVEDVERFIEVWDELKPYLPESAYESVKERLLLQLDNAKEWRDVVNTYFARKTAVPDMRGRVIYGLGEDT